MYRDIMGQGQVYQALVCNSKGCTNKTCSDKPFCSIHVEHTPYARWIKSELIRRKREKQQLTMGVYIPADAHLIQEGLRALAAGYYSLGAIGRTLDLNMSQSRTLVYSMEALGLGETMISARYGLMLSPVVASTSDNLSLKLLPKLLQSPCYERALVAKFA